VDRNETDAAAPRQSPRRRGLLLAIFLPAVAGGAGALLADGGGGQSGSVGGGSPAGLARAAEVQAGSPPRRPRRRLRPAPPTSISIPAAGIEARVEPVAADGEGTLRVPAVGRAGWYDGGPRPGEPGRAVIIGHLDSRRGPGLFARVPRLPPGTTVSIADDAGEVHRFNVIGGAQVEKDHFPAEHVYGGSGGPVLVLITCGGEFVEGEGYRDNVLVYARPV